MEFMERANETIDTVQDFGGGVGQVVGSIKAGYDKGTESGGGIPIDVQVSDSGNSIQKIALILGAAAIGVAIIIAISKKNKK